MEVATSNSLFEIEFLNDENRGRCVTWKEKPDGYENWSFEEKKEFKIQNGFRLRHINSGKVLGVKEFYKQLQLVLLNEPKKDFSDEEISNYRENSVFQFKPTKVLSQDAEPISLEDVVKIKHF
jgi:hypothetical protein